MSGHSTGRRKREVIVAQTAGFCFGVERAVRLALEAAEGPGPVATLGPLVHNRLVTDELAAKGVGILHSLDDWRGETVLIRAHGVAPQVEATMRERGIPFIDGTCPCVKALQSRAAESRRAGRTLILLGEANHPEVIGVLGYAGAAGAARATGENPLVTPDVERLQNLPAGRYTLVAQTTFLQAAFHRAKQLLEAQNLDVVVHATICPATERRQQEAADLSKKVDAMVVLGDPQSANTQKLYEICKKNAPKAFFAQKIHDIQLQELFKSDRIGITAGASAPPSITKEAFHLMNAEEQNINTTEGMEDAGAVQPEMQSGTESQEESSKLFEDMLNESLVTLHTGDVVKGTVIQVTAGEITVNLGYKSDGIITKGEYSDNSSLDLTEVVKEGDVIEVLVMRVNDGDGNVLVSKRRLDAQTNYKLIEQAFNDKALVVGKIQDLVKGGLIANIFGNRVFVPSSQISNRYVEDLSIFKGKEFNFNILEFDRSKRRIVAGRKELAAQEQKVRREELFATLELGQKIDGTVSRITDFGAFIDLGGVDGLVHISELACRRVRKVSDVLSVGDAVTVTVIDINPEKNKISLTLKDINNNPWNNIAEKYPVDSLIEGKVVRMAAFGAFVNLEDGVDGLVHVSQIAHHHIAKPEDELSIGQTITVRVTDIDEANKKISLSKKAAEAQYDLYDDEYEDDYADDEADETAENVADLEALDSDGVAETEEL